MSLQKAFQDCPHFNSCSCNNCPLSTIKYDSIPGDPETKCQLSKNKRKKIAAKYNLANKGLTRSEITAKKRWDNQSDERKKQIIKNLEKSPLRQK